MTEAVQLPKTSKSPPAPLVVIDGAFLKGAAKDAFRQFFVPITSAFRTRTYSEAAFKRAPSRRR